MRVLSCHRDRAAHVLLTVLTEIMTAERHVAMRRVEEAEQQVGDRRLARATWTNQRDPFTRLERQAEAIEDKLPMTGISR